MSIISLSSDVGKCHLKITAKSPEPRFMGTMKITGILDEHQSNVCDSENNTLTDSVCVCVCVSSDL